MKKGFIVVLGLVLVLVLIVVFRNSGAPPAGAGSKYEPTPAEGPYEEGRYALYRLDEEIGWAEYVLSRGVGRTISATGSYELKVSPSTDVIIRGTTTLVQEEKTNIPISYEGVTSSILGDDVPPDTVTVKSRFHSGMADVVVHRKSGALEKHVAMRPGFIVIENFGFQILTLAARQFWELDLQTVHTSVFYPSSQEQGDLHFTRGAEEVLEIGERSIPCRVVKMDMSVGGRTSAYTFWIDAGGIVQKIESSTQDIVAILQSVTEV